jgi:hypothetical protein
LFYQKRKNLLLTLLAATNRTITVTHQDNTEWTLSESLTYRLFEPGDLPGLLRLWEEHSGWGAITEEQWRQWFLDTPYGPSLISVAIDKDGTVAGQTAFMPARLDGAGHQLRALRVNAPILRQELRSANLRQPKHPVVQMLLTGIEGARNSGFEIIYGFPEHAWLPFFRWMRRVGLPNFAEAEYDCMTLTVNADSFSHSDLALQEVTTFGDEYDQLWADAQRSFPLCCGVIRSSQWMNFRNGGRTTIEVRQPGTYELVGYAAFKRQTNLLADTLARNPVDLVRVLRAAIGYLGSSAGKEIKTSAMATPMLLPALKTLGFSATDYKFAFVCNSIGDHLPEVMHMPGQWYVTPGD